MERVEHLHRHRALVGAAVACWIGAGALALVVGRVQHPFAIDRLAFRVVELRPFGLPVVPYGIATHLVGLGTIRVFVIAVCALVAASLLSRDRFGAMIAIAPPLAVVLTELIAKPLVGRHQGGVYSFPSGHATAVSALAMHAAILCYRRWGRPGAIPVALGLAGITAVGILCIVRAQTHVLSDTIAGVLVGYGTVLGITALLSAVLERTGARHLRTWLE